MTSRGAIHWLDLGEIRGSAPAKRRPVVVIQADRVNRTPIATAVVVALTSHTAAAAYPWNVFLPASATGLPKDCVARVNEIFTADLDDLGAPAGQVPAVFMHDISQGLSLLLGL